MSPSLKYLMVWSIAARNASSDPMSLTATLGVEVACVLLVMCGLAPDADRITNIGALRSYAVNGAGLARPGLGRLALAADGEASLPCSATDRDRPHEDTAQ